MKKPLCLKDLLKLLLNLHVNYQQTEIESIPFMELSSLAKDIHSKTRETSQNTDICKNFQGSIRPCKSYKVRWIIMPQNQQRLMHKKDSKKSEEVAGDPTYSKQQRQPYKDRIQDLETEKQARLEILSQNRKDLLTQVARIKQTIKRALNHDASLAQRIFTLICEQDITIISVLIVLSMTIATIMLTITGSFGR